MSHKILTVGIQTILKPVLEKYTVIIKLNYSMCSFVLFFLMMLSIIKDIVNLDLYECSLYLKIAIHKYKLC